jgi:hypothetical protein
VPEAVAKPSHSVLVTRAAVRSVKIAVPPVKEPMEAVFALSSVPLAVVKPSQPLVVFSKEAFVPVRFEAKKFVVVAFVPVPFVKVKAWRFVFP